MFTTEDKLAMKDMLIELGLSDPVKLEYLDALKVLAEQNATNIAQNAEYLDAIKVLTEQNATNITQNAANITKLDTLITFIGELNRTLRIDLGKILDNQAAILTQIKDKKGA